MYGKRKHKFIAGSMAFLVGLNTSAVYAFAEETQSLSEQYSSLYTQASSLNESDYTAESWATFNETWSAMSSFDDISQFSEQMQALWVSRLQTALDSLVKADNTNEYIQQYKKLYAQASSLNESDYTAESWATFNETWSAMSSFDDISQFSEQMQSLWVSRLQTALDLLVKTNASATNEYVQQYKKLYAQALALKKVEYTADSLATFNETWSSMSSIDDISQFSEQTQDLWVSRLQTALDSLVKKKNYQIIYDMVEEMKNYNSEDYTPESWEKFQTELDRYIREKIPQLDEEIKTVDDISENGGFYYRNLQRVYKFLVPVDQEEVVLTDDETGIELISNNYDLPYKPSLNVKVYDENNWPFGKDGTFCGDMPTNCSVYKAYEISALDYGNTLIDEIGDDYTVTIPISEDFDLSTLEVIITSRPGGRYNEPFEIDEDKRLLTITYQTENISNGGTVWLSNPKSAADVRELADGTYSVNVKLSLADNPSVASMSDPALVHDTYLVKNKDNIDLYLEFVPLYPFGLETPSYIGGIWCEKGKKQDDDYFRDSLTVLSYYTDDSGALIDNDIYDALTEVPCVKKLKLRLEPESYNEYGGYTVAVGATAVAAMNGLSYEEIIMDSLCANLVISNVENVGVFGAELPAYDKSVLRKEIDLAKTYDKSDYTPESYANLINILETAQNVYDNSDSASSDYIKQAELVKEAVAMLVIDDSIESISVLNGYSISLSGDIGLNFFMNLSDEVLADSGAKVQITLPDGSTEDILVSGVTPGENGYQFTANVAAKEMTDNVTAQVLLSDGTKGEVYTHSVKQYADVLLADTNTSDDTKTLVKYMLNYGGYAQEYFAYNTANLANVSLTSDEKSLSSITDLSSYQYSVSGSESGIAYSGSKLSLESRTIIKHYFSLSGDKAIEDYTFTVNGTAVTPVKSGNMYCVTVENIGAQNLAIDYFVSVGSLGLTYSPMSYAYSVLTKTDKTSLQNVVKALYLYNQAAVDYSNS